MKKIPERTCVGCGISKSKKELVRIVREKNGNICIDSSGRINGRGAYICAKEECLEKAIKSNRLLKAFEIDNIDEKIYEDLRDVIANIPR